MGNRYSDAYKGMMLMQSALLEIVLDVSVKPAERASCANAFCNIESMKRKMRMAPDPRPIDVSRLMGKRAKVIEFTAPTEPVAEQAIEAGLCSNGQEPTATNDSKPL